MSTELQVWTPPGLPSKDEFETMRSMAVIYAKSSAVRECFRGNPENCFIAVSVGRELGIPPTLALSKGYVIEGGYQLEADVLGDIIRRNVPGLSWEVVEQNDELCTIKGGIVGQREHTVTFTFQMAKEAGWTEGKYGIKNQWRPGARQDTMYAKCVRRLAKRTGGLWCSLYTADPEEAPDTSSPATVPHEPSTATVVDDPEPRVVVHKTAAMGTSESGAAGVSHVEKPVEDWHYRLLCAVAENYNVAAKPPTKQPGRNRWAANYADKLGFLCAEFYKERGETPPTRWAMVPPMDYENIALWLEARNAKRAGSAGQDAPVAQDEPPAHEVEPMDGPANLGAAAGAEVPGEQATIGFDAPPPPEDEPAPPAKPSVTELTETLSSGSLDDLLRALDDLKFRAKGARRYYEIDPKTGNPFLRDGEFLTDLGYVQEVTNKAGAKVKAPVSQWLKPLWAKDADRVMLARRVAEALCAPEDAK